MKGLRHEFNISSSSGEYLWLFFLDRVVKSAGTSGHILNLGHGVLVGTPEEAVAHFFDVSKSFNFEKVEDHVSEADKVVAWRQQFCNAGQLLFVHLRSFKLAEE